MLKKLLAASATIILAAGVSVVAIATPAAATAPAVSSLAGNHGFTVLTEGDATFDSPAETEGSWAVGGSVLSKSGKYSIIAGGHQATADLPVVEGKATRLLVNGTVTLPANGDERINVQPGDGAQNVTIGSSTPVFTQGTNGRIASSAAGASWIQSGNPVGAVNPFPTSATAYSSAFGTGAPSSTFTDYRALSTQLYGLSGTDVAYPLITKGNVNGTNLGSSDLGITLVADKVNVWNVTADQLGWMQGSWFNLKFFDGNGTASDSAALSPTTTLVINLPSGTTTFQNPSFANSTGVAPYVLWNVDTTSLKLTGAQLLSGSVLAPNASLEFNKSTPAEGQFVAASATVTGSGEIHHIGYNGTLPTPKSASGSFSFTDTACAPNAAANTLTVNAADHIKYTWTAGPLTGDFTSYSSTGLAAGTYAFSVTAIDGYTLTGDTSFSHTFAKAGTCTVVTTPVCLPKNAVSYTYDPATNSGVVTVVNPDPTKYSDTLCDSFWVTATSWKYTTSALWPQSLDVVQKLPQITKVGTYNYAAAVSCGQGDIYASFTAQPSPPAQLTGPSAPWSETFLHGMGFTGPNPTYVQQTPGCNEVTPVDPTSTNEACVAGALVGGSITLGLESGLVYSIDGPGTANDVSPVTTKTTTNLPAGKYTVSVVASAGSVLTGATSWPKTVTITPASTCNLPTHALVNPSFSSTPLTCTAAGTYTIGERTPGTVTWTVNGKVTAPGKYNVTKPQDITFVATATKSGDAIDPSFTQPGTVSFTAPSTVCGGIPTLALVTPTFSSTQPTCTSAATYTLGALTAGSVTWTVNGKTGVAGGTYPATAGSTVTAVAAPTDPKDGLDPAFTNPVVLKFGTAPSACSDLPTLAFTGLATSSTLLLAGGLVFIGLIGLLIARRRWSIG